MAGAAAPCRVCGVASPHDHFGAHVCRACAAFFRRTIALKNGYVCRRNKNCRIMAAARHACRACRFMKCLDIGMREDDVKARLQEKQVKASPSLEISTPSLTRLQAAYTKLQERRRFLHSDPATPSTSTGRLVSFAAMEKMSVADIGDIKATLADAFDEYSMLLPSQQKLLYDQFFGLFNMLENCYFTAISGQRKFFYLPTGDYYDLFHEDTYVFNGPSADNAMEEIMKSVAENACSITPSIWHNLVEPMARLKVDEIEFLVLGVLQFWTRGLDRATEATEALVAKVQTRLVEELLDYMSTKEVLEPGQRLCELLIIGAQLYRIEHRLQALFAKERMSDLYQMDETLYRLFTIGV